MLRCIARWVLADDLNALTARLDELEGRVADNEEALEEYPEAEDVDGYMAMVDGLQQQLEDLDLDTLQGDHDDTVAIVRGLCKWAGKSMEECRRFGSKSALSSRRTWKEPKHR